MPNQLDQFWKIMRQCTALGLALGPQCFEDRFLKFRQLSVEIQKARRTRISPRELRGPRNTIIQARLHFSVANRRRLYGYTTGDDAFSPRPSTHIPQSWQSCCPEPGTRSC